MNKVGKAIKVRFTEEQQTALDTLSAQSGHPVAALVRWCVDKSLPTLAANVAAQVPEEVKEDNVDAADCTVHALAYTLGCNYQEAFNHCREAGRHSNRGMTEWQIKGMLESLLKRGYIRELKRWSVPLPTRLNVCAATEVTRRTIWGGVTMYHRRPPAKGGITLAQFLRRLPKTGRFYLTTKTHAFAYVNGCLRDNLSRSQMRARMRSCVEVVPNESTIDGKPSA